MAAPLRTTMFVLAATLLVAAGLATPVAAEEPFCYECHDEFPEFSSPHDPADSGDCTACHEDHEDAEELRLVEEGAALCYQCHDEMTGGASVHPPVEDGECTSCHSPHGSDNEVLLVTSQEKLCFECHDEMSGGASVHPPVEDGECTSCHSPHGSDNEALLVTPREELCFECHDQGFNDPVEHAALDDGCGECHQPHNSEFPRLFTANLTLDRLARYEEEQGRLCFNCHDAEVMAAARTEDTEFRHGTTNLHALHLTGGAKPNKYGFIKKKDGQTCVACHLPHSSLQQRLLRTSFECKGIFCYTMKFRPNETGGTCIVGCHKPRTYSRDATQESSTAKASSTITVGVRTARP
jgi:predicted CXXCH cytochrome family protein